MTDEYRPTVLIVDDEEMVTTSLRSLFRLQSSYQVITHTSPKQALAAAGSAAVDLVIADYLMPEMDGITFLYGRICLTPRLDDDLPGFFYRLAGIHEKVHKGFIQECRETGNRRDFAELQFNPNMPGECGIQQMHHRSEAFVHVGDLEFRFIQAGEGREGPDYSNDPGACSNAHLAKLGEVLKYPCFLARFHRPRRESVK